MTPAERMRAMRERNAELRAAGAIVRFDPIEKAHHNPHSLRLAINAKCWDCQGGACDPAPRRRIRECSLTRCSLHPVRPYQRADDEPESAESADD